MVELKDLAQLRNLHIHHVMIESIRKKSIPVKPVGTVQFDPGSASNLAKIP